MRCVAGYVTIRSKIRANIFTRIFEQKTYSSSVLFVVSGKLPRACHITRSVIVFEGYLSRYVSKPCHLSRLVVFDLGNLATEVAELPGGEMPGDFDLGRDPHPIHLPVLVGLT